MKIRFGGPALNERQSTWYDSLRGGRHIQVRADYGAIVDAAQVMRCHGEDASGRPIMGPNADYYVQAGMASFLEDEQPASPAAPVMPAEED